MRVDIPHNGWKPRDYQRAAWRAWHVEGMKRLSLCWHRRAGKDEIAMHGTLIKMLERPASYVHCLPLQTQCKKAIWTQVNAQTGRRRIFDVFPEALIETKLENEMFIRLKNGSTWQLLGSDNYDSYVGAGAAGLVFSEMALSNPSAWAYFRPMVVENEGWAVFISTPRGRNFFKTMHDYAMKSENWFAQTLPITETKALSKSDIEDALNEYKSLFGKDLGQAKYEQEYECSFNAAIPGAYYAREMLKVRTEGRISPEVVAVKGQGVHTVWDLGVTKGALAIWFFQVVGAQVYILDVMVTGDLGIDQAKEQIDERREKYGWTAGFDFVPHDAKVREIGATKGRSRVETMIANDMKPQMVPAQTVDDGMNAVRQTLPFCVFHPRCEEVGIAALEQYRREWDDDKKTFRNRPVADWCSHPADAFRYLSLSWKLVEKAYKKVKEPQPSGTVMLPGAPVPTSSTRIKI